MRFVNLPSKAKIILDDYDLVYDREHGELGFIKDSYGNIYEPVSPPQIITSLKESPLEVSLVPKQRHHEVEKEVEEKWVAFLDYLVAREE